ncbi:MAG: outer membrane lipoprotein carrier protein LolA [Pseudomonadota bacterium]
MERRTFLAAALSLAAPLPAFAQDELAALSRYINDISTAGGRFTQTNFDGTISTGKYWINRPGLMRFQYDPPNGATIIADGLWLGVVDPVPGTDIQRYPLSMTPLKLLLDERVRLRRDEMVESVERRDGHLVVTARDPDRPEIGTIALVFREEPLELLQWITLDAGGRATVVVLDSMERGEDYSRALFSIEQAEFNRDR